MTTIMAELARFAKSEACAPAGTVSARSSESDAYISKRDLRLADIVVVTEQLVYRAYLQKTHVCAYSYCWICKYNASRE